MNEQKPHSAQPRPVPACWCEEHCACPCHTGSEIVEHTLPCCGPGSANHWLYCDGNWDGMQKQKGGK